MREAMRFRRLNKSKIIGRDLMRIKIRYFADGKMESQVQSKEGGRWKNISMCFGENIPTWDHLHKCGYIGRGNSCFEPPNPINAVVKHMQYVVHCFGIDEALPRKRR